MLQRLGARLLLYIESKGMIKCTHDQELDVRPNSGRQATALHNMQFLRYKHNASIIKLLGARLLLHIKYKSTRQGTKTEL